MMEDRSSQLVCAGNSHVMNQGVTVKKKQVT